MELKFIVEAILFSTDKPLAPKEIRGALDAAAQQSEDESVQQFKKTKEETITQALQELESEHAEADRSFRLVCIAGAWQFVTLPDYAPWLRGLLGKKNRPARLSQPALETLAIIAYRQPLTRSEIEEIRGVSVDAVIQTLLDRELIEPAGRAEVVGRPVTYATTPYFLEYFGLGSLEDLPEAEELKRIPVTQPTPEEPDAQGESTPEAEADSDQAAQAEQSPDTEAEEAPEESPAEAGDTQTVEAEAADTAEEDEGSSGETAPEPSDTEAEDVDLEDEDEESDDAEMEEDEEEAWEDLDEDEDEAAVEDEGENDAFKSEQPHKPDHDEEQP